MIYKFLIFMLAFTFILSEATYPYKCKPKDRKTAFCTMEYIGVCGWWYRSINCYKPPCATTEATICTACKNKHVDYVTLGECPKASQKKTYCKKEDRNKPCTREYKPVCAWYNSNVNCLVYPCAIKASNKCTACTNKDIQYYTPGECPSTNPIA